MLSHKEWAVQALPDQPVTQGIDYQGLVEDVLALRRRVLDDALLQFAARAQALAQIAKLLVGTLRAGHKVLVAGNGGSAAVANDYGYAEVFARQVRGFGQPGDLLLLFSTSGESENLVRAALEAQQCLMSVAAITGDRSSRLEQIADITLRVPVVDTAIAQELHMMATHILCDITETELAQWEVPASVEDRFRLEQEGI